MRLKNRRYNILAVVTLTIAIILASTLQTRIISFNLLKTEQNSSDNIDEGISYSPDLEDDVETIITSEIIENPIHIDDNAANNWEWAEDQSWCSGSGVESDPYVIKDLKIDGGGSGCCILIQNSNVFFRIENCEVYNSGVGIRLINTMNGEILNNDCSDNIIGIGLLGCNKNIILGNTANNNDEDGIRLKDSSNENIVKNNILFENIVNGISIVDSSENNVTENSLRYNDYGIIIFGASSDNSFYLNSFYRSSYGHTHYFVYTGSGNSWDDGSVGNYWDDYTGVDADDDDIGDTPYYTWNMFEIDNYPLWGYYSFVIDELGGGDYTWEEANVRYWCSGSGTVDDPYIIQNLILNPYAGTGRISIKNSDAYFRIENCKTAISLSNTNNGELFNNNVSCIPYTSFGFGGIDLVNSNYNIISENIASIIAIINDYGIALTNSSHNIITGNTIGAVNSINLVDSHYNIISGNNIITNYYNGIGLFGCKYNHICNNTISNIANFPGNFHDPYPRGIYVSYYDIYRGIGDWIYFESKYNMISENYIYNQCEGIYLLDTNHDIITENTIADVGYGIEIEYSGEHNIIYLNSFYRSSLGHINYYNYRGSGNSWDKGGLGNYWDDYTGIDENGDGIGDTPYEIRVYNSEYDHYPLIEPHKSESPPIHTYAHVSPIYIDNTAENNWAWAKDEYNLPGSGTEDDPYIIQNFIIDGGGSAVGSCISIQNSDVYFRIENCKLHGSGFGGLDAAIRFRNTDNGEIIDNDISQTRYGCYGIYLWRSNGNDIRNNILVENIFGIIISNSNDNAMIENTFIDHYIGIIIVGTSSGNIGYQNSYYGSLYSNVYYL